VFFEQTREGRGGEEIKPSTFASYEARWTKHIAPKWGERRVGGHCCVGRQAAS
jgi:hypothetical protein